MVTALLTVPLGVLSSNLPPSMRYQAGTPIHLELVVSNPTLLPREYSLHLQVAKNDEVVEERTIAVNDVTSFIVMGNGQICLYGEESISVSDATFSILLYDYATEQYVSSVTSQLYSGFISPTFPWEKMLVGFAGLLMIGVVVAVITGIVRGKHE